MSEAGTAIVSMVILSVPPTIQVASVGIPDTLFLMLLALVVFGPRRLPEIGRQIGKLMYEFRKVSNDFKFQMEEELRASEEAERQRKLTAAPMIQPVAALDARAPSATDPYPPAVESATSSIETEAEANVSAESSPDVPDAAPAVDGEVRGEPRRFPQDHVQGQMQSALRVQPPTSGETIAAQKPFRGRQSEVTTESGDAPTKVVETPVVVEDDGRIGTEVQPGVTSDSAIEREAHHG